MKPMTQKELEELHAKSKNIKLQGPVNTGRIVGPSIPIQILSKAEKVQRILEAPGKNMLRRQLK